MLYRIVVYERQQLFHPINRPIVLGLSLIHILLDKNKQNAVSLIPDIG